MKGDDPNRLLESGTNMTPEQYEEMLALVDTLGVRPVDGTARQLHVPATYPRWGRRWISPSGATLDLSDPTVVCGPGGTPGSCSFKNEEATMTSWYPDESALGRPMESSFSADGRSLMLLLIGGDAASELLLVTLEDPGEVRVAARTAIEPHATHAFITYVAPDDSLVAAEVWHEGHEDRDQTVILIPTTGEAITMHDGRLAGFVSDVSAASWPTS